MPKLINLIGKTFKKLTVISFSHRTPPHTYWVCSCSCGGQTVASTNNLRRGRHASCGCGHGLSRTPEYETWYNIKLRCGLTGEKAHKNYIHVSMDPVWENSFESFLKDVGKRPSSAHSIDRINPHKGYIPGNVRWVTNLEQARNKRQHSKVALPSGKILTTWEYADLLGVSRKRAWHIAQKEGFLVKITAAQKPL